MYDILNRIYAWKNPENVDSILAVNSCLIIFFITNHKIINIITADIVLGRVDM